MKSLLCQMGNFSHTQMMGYILRTEDGKIICVDAGTTKDSAHFWEVLKKICGTETPHVDAWFLTHAHNDHLGAFYDVMNDHYGKDLTVDGFYFHMPSMQFIDRYEPEDNVSIHTFYQTLPVFADKAMVVSETDSYQIGEAKVDVLYTSDESFFDNAINNSSIVIRVLMGGKSILFLADLGVEGGAKLLRNYGENLKSDFCQMAHHGQNGVEEDVYRAIHPETCLWCAPEWLWNNDKGNGFNTHIWKTVTVRGWMEKLGVRNHIVEKDGDIIVEW